MVSRGVHKSLRLPVKRAFLDGSGDLVSVAFVNEKLTKTIETVRDLTNWSFDCNPQSPEYFMAIADGADPFTGEVLPANNAEIGRRLGYDVFGLLPEEMIGKSRVERLVRFGHVALDKSMGDKWLSYSGGRRISEGYRRTLSLSPPRAGSVVNFGAVDSQYCSVSWSVDRSLLVVRLVAFDVRVCLEFEVPVAYRGADRVANPSVSLGVDGCVSFLFSFVFERLYPEVSSRFVVGVDVGKRFPYVVSVVDVESGGRVASVFPSQRVMSLARDVRVTERQIRSLCVKRDAWVGCDERYWVYELELREERLGLSRKRRELAVLVGQEVVGVALDWGNAVIGVEDLSWIVNTMQNGRWNRGEFVRWVRHYANVQGLLVYSVSAAHTSTSCSVCGVKGYFDGRVFRCSGCGLFLDRDANASVNIGKRVVGRALKSVTTRIATRGRRGVSGSVVRRVPVRREFLKKKSRDKSVPTPKRPRGVKKDKLMKSGSCVKRYAGGTYNKVRSDSNKQPIITHKVTPRIISVTQQE